MGCHVVSNEANAQMTFFFFFFGRLFFYKSNKIFYKFCIQKTMRMRKKSRVNYEELISTDDGSEGGEFSSGSESEQSRDSASDTYDESSDDSNFSDDGSDVERTFSDRSSKTALLDISDLALKIQKSVRRLTGSSEVCKDVAKLTQKIYELSVRVNRSL